jgi:DNA-binding CsgD family transcriptional regulator
MNGSLSLTPRERQIIDLAAAGKSDVDTAETLGLTPHTVRSYWRNLRRKLRASSRGQIIARVLGEAVTADQRGAVGESLLQPIPVDLDSLREAGISETVLSAVALSLNVAMVIAWGSTGQIVFCNAVTEQLLLREIQLPGAVDWQGFRRPGSPLPPLTAKTTSRTTSTLCGATVHLPTYVCKRSPSAPAVESWVPSPWLGPCPPPMPHRRDAEVAFGNLNRPTICHAAIASSCAVPAML